MDEAERTPELRISDADRHAVAEILREAAGEGRLDMDELDARLEATYAARTYPELVPITSDLPTSLPRPRDPSAAVERPAATGTPVVRSGEPVKPVRHFAVMSGVERKGVWTVPAQMTVTAFWGGADLDLREARFGAAECVLTVNAIMGGAHVVVGPDVDVVVEGVGIMGGYSGPSDRVEAELTPDSPTLRIKGFALWGGVDVERKRRRDELPPGGKPRQID
ncbi:DUF1707 SHOCT-like domain-containing protein [Nocardioides sp. GXZ039]|uniref:DUF1707 SHOCT-like domain-containing protein n=1 Tax=Nocardioides sp. GXZ039 TaxID=3136018 RepID=UPI0030F43268